MWKKSEVEKQDIVHLDKLKYSVTLPCSVLFWVALNILCADKKGFRLQEFWITVLASGFQDTSNVKN